MQTSYIYSASRVNALAQFLLTKTDINRLLVAEAGADLQSALKETYLAPYVLRVQDEDMPAAIEQTLIDAKRLIHRIAPQGDMFRVLWVQYDFHNLRVFAKAQAQNRSYAEIAGYTSKRGIYDPAFLFTHAEQGTLNRLQPGWQQVFADAVELVGAGKLDLVDGIFDAAYFATARKIAARSNDAFIQRYTKVIIDLYNLKSGLRAVTYPQAPFTPTCIAGGTIAATEFATKEQILAAFTTLGGADVWRSALEYYEATGNTTQIDARADEYLVLVAKRASVDMFSSASLVLYYQLCRQAAANIRTIVVGKNSGLDEAAIRANLRMAHVNN